MHVPSCSIPVFVIFSLFFIFLKLIFIVCSNRLSSLIRTGTSMGTIDVFRLGEFMRAMNVPSDCWTTMPKKNE